MPDNMSMKKYGKMLDEIASKYPELEEAVMDFQDELSGAMEGAIPSEEEAPAEDDAAFPPMPSKPKAARKGEEAEEEVEDEDLAEDEDESSYKF